MKFIYAITLVLFANSVLAQQPFQGSISYNLHFPGEKDAELLIFFAPNKIKVKFKEKEDYDQTYLLIDLDSGKFYTLNGADKTFTSKKLSEKASPIVASPKTIAGYTTNPVSMSNSGFKGILGSAENTVLYTAPGLYYPVPEKYTGIPELVMIQNNHIVLGAEVKITYPGMTEELPDSMQNKMNVMVEAKEVSARSFDIAEFSIPADFSLQSNKQYSRQYSMDSTEVMEDSVAIPPPPKEKVKTNSKPSTPQKKTPVKSEAIKPKKTQPKT